MSIINGDGAGRFMKQYFKKKEASRDGQISLGNPGTRAFRRKKWSSMLDDTGRTLRGHLKGKVRVGS